MCVSKNKNKKIANQQQSWLVGMYVENKCSAATKKLTGKKKAPQIEKNIFENKCTSAMRKQCNAMPFG